MVRHGEINRDDAPSILPHDWSRDIDGFKGCAVVLVLLYHATALTDLSGAGAVESMLYTLCGFGFAGVNLFFVVAGFLLTRSLLRDRDQPYCLRQYYWRRITRIGPGYFAFLCVMALIAITSTVEPPQDATSKPSVAEAVRGTQSSTALLFAGTFTTNYQPLFYESWPPPGWYFFGHLWSFGVGVQFFLIWPFVVCAVSPPTLRWLCAGLFIFAPVFRLILIANGANQPYPEPMVYFQVLSHVDSLAGGAFVACLLESRRLTRTHAHLAMLTLLSSSVALAAGVFLQSNQQGRDGFIHAWAFTLCALIWSSTIVLSLTRRSSAPLRRWVRQPSFRWCGKFCFGLYTFHWPIMLFVSSVVNRNIALFHGSRLPAFLSVAVGTAVVVAPLALLSHRLFERRFLPR